LHADSHAAIVMGNELVKADLEVETGLQDVENRLHKSGVE
jgi:hypothetical protein